MTIMEEVEMKMEMEIQKFARKYSSNNRSNVQRLAIKIYKNGQIRPYYKTESEKE